MNNIINEYLIKIVFLIVVALAGWLGIQIKNLYAKYVNTEVKRSIAAAAVRFVEQVYIDLHGHDKLMKALERASELAAENGIIISETELLTLIEAAVNEFNNSFGKDDPKPAA